MLFLLHIIFITLDYISVCIVTRAQDARLEFDSRQQQRFSLRLSIQTGSEAHPASYVMAPGVLSPEVKQQSVKLTTHLHLVPRLRTRGPILSQPHTS
jgi:hypothetical protein